MLYRLYGLVISSDNLSLKIATTTGKHVDVRIRQAFHPKSLPPTSKWFMRWHFPDGKLWLSFAKIDGGYVLRFNEIADFFVRDDGNEILYVTAHNIPPDTIQHLLLDQVIPLIINLRGREALHASAVLTPWGVVAFTGVTGSGKSTLVASFVSMGYPFMSDDCLALLDKGGEIYGMPAYPGLRLWEDAQVYLFGDNGAHESVAHYTNKRRLDIEKEPGAYCTEPQPFRRLYFIADSSEAKVKTDIIIESLSPRNSFMALVQCAFRLDITDRNMLKRQFRFLERVASKISVRRLIFPRNFDILPSVRETILSDLKDLDN